MKTGRPRLPPGEAARRRKERNRRDAQAKNDLYVKGAWRNMLVVNAVREILGLDPIPNTANL